MSSELITKTFSRSYLEIVVISGNIVINRTFEKERGQKWIVIPALNAGFILPDRNEGLKSNSKVVYHFTLDKSTPLSTLAKTDKDLYKDIIYTLDKDNSLRKTMILAEQVKFQSTNIDPEILKSIIDTKVVTELLKPTISMWESLKYPLIIGAIMIGLIGTVYLI
jgi:hypothetical protein